MNWFFSIVLSCMPSLRSHQGRVQRMGHGVAPGPIDGISMGGANLANIVACAPCCPLKALLLSFQIVKHNSALFWILCTVTSAWSTLVIVQTYPNTLEAGVQILVFYTLFVSDQIFGFLVLHVPHYSKYPAQTPPGAKHPSDRAVAGYKQNAQAGWISKMCFGGVVFSPRDPRDLLFC